MGFRSRLIKNQQEMDVLYHQLFELEKRLMQPECRRCSAEVALLLGDDFREFGASGRVYDKTLILELLQQDTDESSREMSEFQIQVLAPDVVLVTYRVARESPSETGVFHSLRSSIWQWREERR